MRRVLAARTVRTLGVSIAMAAVLASAGCATGPDRHPGDPLEPMNRVIFNFNDGIDKYVARPVATVLRERGRRARFARPSATSFRISATSATSRTTCCN